MPHALLDSKSPVVLFANAIGDHLLALPALRALTYLFPGRLRLLGLPETAGLLLRDVPFHSVIPLPVECVLPGQGIEFDYRRTLSAIGDCDLFLSLVPWHTRSLTELLKQISCPSAGFFEGFSTVLPLRYDQHSAELAFDVPRHLDPSLSIDEFSSPPAATSPGRVRALAAGFRILVVHADTQPAKMWHWDGFVSVLRRFFDTHSDFLGLLIGMPNAAVNPSDLAQHLVPCLGIPIPETLGIIGLADLFLGVDSCFLHAADLFRVPGVALFGPTDAAEFGFRFSRHRHIQASGSMDQIVEHEVVAALDQLAAIN